MITLAVDIGGTFTDIVCIKDDKSLYLSKVSSTPPNYIKGVINGIKKIQHLVGCDYSDIQRFVHGTTVATNIMLERNGATLGILATEGFEDILELGRLNRTEMYNLFMDEQTPTFLAPRRFRQGVRERIGPDGQIITKLDRKEVLDKVALIKEKYDIQSIAVCYLFSYKNPIHELMTRDIIRTAYPEISVSLSCEVDPIFREYERLCMTVFDAYVKPRVTQYIVELQQEMKRLNMGARLQIMQSSGGITSSEVVAEKPVLLFLSGPAGGVMGGSYVGKKVGFGDVITVDIGGTSCDVSLVKDGRPLFSKEGKIFIYPMRGRKVDVNTIGAGGGSIAWIDTGGGLRVGPQSAGANPGPACYKRGARLPTVTDASLVLNYLNPEYFAGGDIVLDRSEALKAIETISKPLNMDVVMAAYGIHKILNSNMSNQIRLVTISRGYDPRKFALVLLGGAGPVHGGALLRELGIETAIIPPSPGVLSAFGLLVANVEHHASRTFLVREKDVDMREVTTIFEEMEKENEAKMRIDKVPLEKVTIIRAADMRYVGQSYEIEVPILGGRINPATRSEVISKFHELHELTYGHSDASMPVEFVNFRITHSYGFPTPELEKIKTSTSSLKEAQKEIREAFFGPDFGFLKTPILQREKIPVKEKLRGPLIIEQIDTTTVVYPDQACTVDEFGNIILNNRRG